MGEIVEVGEAGISVLVGRGVLVAVGEGKRRGTDKLLENAISIRMNISIKKRRMDIL